MLLSKSLTRKCAVWTMSASASLYFAASTPAVAETLKAAPVVIASNGDSGDLTAIAPILAQTAALAKGLANSDSAALAALWSPTGQYVDKDGDK